MDLWFEPMRGPGVVWGAVEVRWSCFEVHHEANKTLPDQDGPCPVRDVCSHTLSFFLHSATSLYSIKLFGGQQASHRSLHSNETDDVTKTQVDGSDIAVHVPVSCGYSGSIPIEEMGGCLIKKHWNIANNIL